MQQAGNYFTWARENACEYSTPAFSGFLEKEGSVPVLGWMNEQQKRPLVNVMAASAGGSMFLKSFDTSANIKDADYVASLFQDVIHKEGAHNVV